MRIILLIVSFLIIIFTFIIFYIGIYDEVYKNLRKINCSTQVVHLAKFNFLISVNFVKYIFKNYRKLKFNLYEQYYSAKTFEMELINMTKTMEK